MAGQTHTVKAQSLPRTEYVCVIMFRSLLDEESAQEQRGRLVLRQQPRAPLLQVQGQSGPRIMSRPSWSCPCAAPSCPLMTPVTFIHGRNKMSRSRKREGLGNIDFVTDARRELIDAALPDRRAR